MMKNSEFGRRVKERRELLKLSPHKLAIICGITPATIYRIESGEIGQLRSESLAKLAKGLRTTSDYLTGGSSEPQPKDILSGDRNAEYLYTLYSQMNVSQIQHLLQFAEFTRYRTLNEKILMDEYHDLFSFTHELIQKNNLEDADERFQKAATRFAGEVTDHAESDVKAEADDEPDKRNYK